MKIFPGSPSPITEIQMLDCSDSLFVVQLIYSKDAGAHVQLHGGASACHMAQPSARKAGSWRLAQPRVQGAAQCKEHFSTSWSSSEQNGEFEYANIFI